MISYIRGTLAFFEEDKVVVDVGGVGYGIYMSGQDMSRLGDMRTQLLFGLKEWKTKGLSLSHRRY